MRPPEETWKDRASEQGIRKLVATRARFARLLRPGATLSGALVLAAATLTALKTASVPDKETWEGGAWLVVWATASGLAAFAYFLVTIGYDRTLKRRQTENEFHQACRDLASLLEKTTGAEWRNIGAHVWTVRGLRGFRYLERRASFGRTELHNVVWRKGKGAVGICWSDDEWLVADVEHLRGEAPNEAAFYALPPEERYGLTWKEFVETKQYLGVIAWPLRTGPEQSLRVRGCVSADIQENGAAERLLAAWGGNREDYAAILSTCQGVLAKERWP